MIWSQEIPSKRAKTNATPEDLSSTSTINDSIAANYINKTPTPTPPIPDQTPPAKLPNSNASSNEDEEDDRDEEEKVEDEREDDLSEVEEPPVDFSITPNRWVFRFIQKEN
jgi:hypothetical protein